MNVRVENGADGGQDDILNQSDHSLPTIAHEGVEGKTISTIQEAVRALGPSSIKYFPFSRIIRSSIKMIKQTDNSPCEGLTIRKQNSDKLSSYEALLKYYGKYHIQSIIKLNLQNMSTYEQLQKVVDLKKMYSKKDWLNNKKEKGQSFQEFVRTKSRNRVSKNKNVVYIMCMDNDIPDDALEKLQKYCAAFFHGLDVKIIQERIDVPTSLKKFNITSRKRKDTNKVQYLATDLLDLLMEKYIPEDAY